MYVMYWMWCTVGIVLNARCCMYYTVCTKLYVVRHRYCIALYVDDRTKLPEDEWVTSSYDGKVKKTIGKKYADFQITNYNINSQPYYVLVDTDGETLVEPKGHDLNIDNFVKFLDDGIELFNK